MPRRITNSISKPYIPSQCPRAQPYAFLNLPFELRLQIYDFLIPRREIIRADLTGLKLLGVKVSDTTPPTQFLSSSNEKENFHNQGRCKILQLCKQISEECLDILYGKNTFLVFCQEMGDYILDSHITEANRRRIRAVIIEQERNSNYCLVNSASPARYLWKTILPNLRDLTISLEDPMGSCSHENLDCEITRRDICFWHAWVTEYITYFGMEYKSRNTITIWVKAEDDDDLEEMMKLIERYMRSWRIQTEKSVRYPYGSYSYAWRLLLQRV